MSGESIRRSSERSTIPVFVRDDLSPVHQLAGMLVENHQRKGLTPTEEAVAIQQLAGFEEVTQRDMTGIKAADVRTALKVAASDVATAVGERHDVSMDQLVVLAAFESDTEVVKTLTAAAIKDPSRFDHVVAQLRRDRDDRAVYEAVAAQITEAGLPVVELDNGWWLPDGAEWLSDLPPLTALGRTLRPDTGAAPATLPLWSKPMRAICASTRRARATWIKQKAQRPPCRQTPIRQRRA